MVLSGLYLSARQGFGSAYSLIFFFFFFFFSQRGNPQAFGPEGRNQKDCSLRPYYVLSADPARDEIAAAFRA